MNDTVNCYCTECRNWTKHNVHEYDSGRIAFTCTNCNKAETYPAATSDPFWEPDGY